MNWVVAAVRLLALSEGRDDPFNESYLNISRSTEALGKFRDLAGTVSHERTASNKLSAHHRRAALLAADAIVTFLHQAYLEREA